MNSDISLEPLLNRKQRIIGTSKYADQVVVEGVGGSTTDRVVLLGDNAVVSDTPTADVSEVHYVNTSGKNIRYGGSGVTATTGGILYNGSTLVFKSPQSNLIVNFIQNSGGPINLYVVEFY
jgi:hypothetical protein